MLPFTLYVVHNDSSVLSILCVTVAASEVDLGSVTAQHCIATSAGLVQARLNLC